MSKSARIFNCVQRTPRLTSIIEATDACFLGSHQNTLEHITTIVSSTLIAGLSRPGLAASLCISWVLGRVSYTIGYSTGDAAKVLTLVLCTISSDQSFLQRNSWGAPLVTAATQICECPT